MKYVNMSIKYYAAQLAAKTPAPGGGSVAALIGALGCGLLSMVANFTIARKGYNGYKERAKKVLKESGKLKANLIDLVDKDILIYEKLSRDFRRYKGNLSKMQSSLKKATTAPLQVCSYAHKAALLSLELAYAGNKSLISDVCVAIHVLDAAFESALVNIKINSRLIRDKKYVADRSNKSNSLHRDLKKVKSEVLSKARYRMFGEAGKHPHEREDFIYGR